MRLSPKRTLLGLQSSFSARSYSHFWISRFRAAESPRAEAWKVPTKQELFPDALFFPGNNTKEFSKLSDWGKFTKLWDLQRTKLDRPDRDPKKVFFCVSFNFIADFGQFKLIQNFVINGTADFPFWPRSALLSRSYKWQKRWTLLLVSDFAARWRGAVVVKLRLDLMLSVFSI